MSSYKDDLRELDATANEFSLKCLRFTTMAFALVWLLNMIGVFIVDRKLMTIVFLISSAVMLAPTLICKCVGTNKPWVKYMILFSSVLAITLIGCALSFHSVLLYALPLIYAAQYSKRLRVDGGRNFCRSYEQLLFRHYRREYAAFDKQHDRLLCRSAKRGFKRHEHKHAAVGDFAEVFYYAPLYYPACFHSRYHKYISKHRRHRSPHCASERRERDRQDDAVL